MSLNDRVRRLEGHKPRWKGGRSRPPWLTEEDWASRLRESDYAESLVTGGPEPPGLTDEERELVLMYYNVAREMHERGEL